RPVLFPNPTSFPSCHAEIKVWEFIKALYNSFGLFAELHSFAVYNSIISSIFISRLSDICIVMLYTPYFYLSTFFTSRSSSALHREKIVRWCDQLKLVQFL